MKREIWDLYDKNRQLTGETAFRGDPLPKNRYNLGVHVWLRVANNKYLISKRTANKSSSLMWETVGGCAIKGDDSLQAALREVKEEVGITLIPNNGQIVHSYFRGNIILDVWLFTQPIDLDDVVYQQEEVCDAKFASREDIERMHAEKMFFDVFEYRQIVFDKE